MKKITLLVGLLVTTFSVNAQNYYNFTKSTATYADLTGATSMNNGVAWDYNAFGPFNAPFPIYIFGQALNNFTFEDDFFFLEDTAGNTFAYTFPVSGYIMDRNFSLTGASLSPISYKVEGTTGSRILKLEVKNAGLEGEAFGSSTSTLYLNYQVWFYEADKSIEYRYGNHNITNLALFNDDASSNVFLGYEDANNLKAGYIGGSIASTTYAETTDPNITLPNLNGIPAANTMYRFELNSLAVKDQEKIEFSMYPNPTNNVLNLTFPNTVNKPYSVYDLMGREVLKGSLNNTTQAQINVSTLQSGSYILRIAGTTQKFVKN